MSHSRDKVIGVVAIIAATIVFSPTVFAAETTSQSDKSQYTLFNPTPKDQMRSFATDRPTKSSSPYTVDAGHFQYETDISNWIYDHYNTSQTTVSNLAVANTVLKAGLTNRTDLEVAFAPININHADNRPAGTEVTYTGVGDVYTRLKFNVFGNDGGNYALAVVPYVKAPTANHHIGNTYWEGGGYVPFIVALPYNWTMNITSEVDILENAALNGTHTNFSNLINFSHSLFDPSLTGYAEFWSNVNNDVGTPNQYTADLAFSWVVKDNLQLDAGVNVGLNKAANDVQSYIGISQRF